MIDTNIKGVLNVSRAVLPLMIRQGRGHVVNLGSTAAHMTYPNGNVYAATKHAILGLSEGMNLDLAGTPLKVTCIDPGFVETEFSLVRFRGDQDRAKNVYKGFRPLTADDVAGNDFLRREPAAAREHSRSHPRADPAAKHLRDRQEDGLSLSRRPVSEAAP